jgi:hypothetical protein
MYDSRLTARKAGSISVGSQRDFLAAENTGFG